MKRIEELDNVVKRLRAPDGCPWDREQTFQSLIPHIIEEAYELADAMEKGDFENLKEELGDVLLHVVMLSAMAEEQNQFNLADVAKDIAEKMVRRHPHVFAGVKVNSVDQVWENWEKIKKTESPKKASPFASIPENLPPLLKLKKIQKKMKRLGLDWKSLSLAGEVETLSKELTERETKLNKILEKVVAEL